MDRFYYQNSFAGFLADSEDAVLGALERNNTFDLVDLQRNARLGDGAFSESSSPSTIAEDFSWDLKNLRGSFAFSEPENPNLCTRTTMTLTTICSHPAFGISA